MLGTPMTDKKQPRYPMPTRCPVSGDPLEITRLEAPTSGVVIEGRFVPNEFALMPEKQLEFLRLFVRTRGNLKEIERILGVSYPTVRQRMESMLQSLGYQADEGVEATREQFEQDQQARAKQRAKSDILAALERGDISPQQATDQLRALKNG
jgi:hypothetical protein